MKFRAFFRLLLVAALLSACSYEHTTGNGRLNPGVATAIKKGITTKAQVRTLLGDPQSTKTQMPIPQPPGVAALPAKWTASEIWAYWTERDQKTLFTLPFMSARPKHSSYTIIIYFDAQGVVLDCQPEEMHT